MAIELNMSSPSDSDSDFEQITGTSWRKMRFSRFKDGFADGKYMGEESAVQDGFNNGYEVGFRTNFQVAVIKGVLGAVEANLKETNSCYLKEAVMLKREVAKLEQLCIEDAKRCIAEGNDRNFHVLPAPMTVESGPDCESQTGSCSIPDKSELIKVSQDLQTVKRNTLELLKKCNYDGLMKLIDDI